MIRTSKNKLRTFVRQQYVEMLAESNQISEEELDELGRLPYKRSASLPPPPPHAGGEAPEMESMGREEMELGDLEDELAGAEWSASKPRGESRWDELEDFDPDRTNPGVKPPPLPARFRKDAGDTQTQMRTLDIVPGERRPLAKKMGLGESNLRTFIASVLKDIK